jgi:hypothetical protein
MFGTKKNLATLANQHLRRLQLSSGTFDRFFPARGQKSDRQMSDR